MQDWLDQLEIVTLIQNWALWRDTGDWDKLRAAVHPDATMTATWFHGRFDDFIDAAQAAWRERSTSHHALGGTSVELNRSRAIAQTRMTIRVRTQLDGVEVDVSCHGRFFDRVEKRGSAWRIARRSVIYEQDRIDPVEPGTRLVLDRTLLERFPEGYRHLAYVQTKAGAKVDPELPTGVAESQKKMIKEARAWLAAAPR
ncbi:MAG TPA: nuclear transport factor 2 family protein [Burkholderiales bacterium]